jgi:hypothetical protein
MESVNSFQLAAELSGLFKSEEYRACRPGEHRPILTFKKDGHTQELLRLILTRFSFYAIGGRPSGLLKSKKVVSLQSAFRYYSQSCRSERGRQTNWSADNQNGNLRGHLVEVGRLRIIVQK